MISHLLWCTCTASSQLLRTSAASFQLLFTVCLPPSSRSGVGANLAAACICCLLLCAVFCLLSGCCVLPPPDPTHPHPYRWQASTPLLPPVTCPAPHCQLTAHRPVCLSCRSPAQRPRSTRLRWLQQCSSRLTRGAPPHPARRTRRRPCKSSRSQRGDYQAPCPPDGARTTLLSTEPNSSREMSPVQYFEVVVKGCHF
jgi:hypothetical protein